MRILPGVLKELMKHVPAVLFQTVEWSELASELPKISKRVISKDGYSFLAESQKSYLAPLPIEITKEPLRKLPVSGDRKEIGNLILKLYFAQLLSPHGLFLDLRLPNFDFSSGHLRWHPPSLWTKFSDSFREGLTQVYDGFYFEDEELFTQGLEGIGLLSRKWPIEDQKKLQELFKSQFGSANDLEMNFKLGEFQQSMIQLANFLLEKKVSINKDFLYLGINLVTLYSALEELGQSHLVCQIYKDLRKSYHLHLPERESAE